jgi:hypothetical protein
MYTYPPFPHMLLYHTQELSIIVYKFIRKSHGSPCKPDFDSIPLFTVEEMALGQVFLQIFTDISKDRTVFLFRIMQLLCPLKKYHLTSF